MTGDAFDLKRFAPPTGVTVEFRDGQTFRFPGDPDVDDVAIMLRLEQEIQGESGDDLAATLTEGKATLKRLILEADPSQDPSRLKVGPEEMLVVVALLVHGATVAEAVGIAITAYNEKAGESQDPPPENETDDERDQRLAREAEDRGPLSRSESGSSERSSGSDAEETSLLATG